MRFAGRRSVLIVALAAAAIGLPGCDKEQTAPTPVATPTPISPAVRGVLGQFSFDQFSSGLYVGIPFTLSQGGILDATVDWTVPSTWMYVYIAKGTCDFEQLSSKTCPYLVASESQVPKPRVVMTEPIPPGTYSLILYNVERNKKTGIGSDNTEGVSFQIGLTVGGGIPSGTSSIDVKPPVFIRP
jgi:hypothetical protein